MAEMARDYVIRKGGYFYRPEARGYCADVEAAGRWTYEDAIPYARGVEGVTVHHLREFPSRLPDVVEADRDVLIRAMEEIADPLKLQVDGVGIARTLALINRMSSIAKDALSRVSSQKEPS